MCATLILPESPRLVCYTDVLKLKSGVLCFIRVYMYVYHYNIWETKFIIVILPKTNPYNRIDYLSVNEA